MPEDQNQDIKKEMRQIRTSWAVHLLVLICYVIFVHLEAKFGRFDPWPNFPPTLVKVIFIALAIYSFILAYYFRKQLLSGRGSLVSEEKLIRRAAKLKKPIFIVRYRTAMTLSLIFSHTIGVYGLALWFLTRDLQFFYLSVCASAGGLILFRPKMQEIEVLMRQ
jgi:uncharacterized membrane protein